MTIYVVVHKQSGRCAGLYEKRPATLGTKGYLEFEVVELDLDAETVAGVRARRLILARDGSTTAAPPKPSAEEVRAQREGAARLLAAAKDEIAAGRLRFAASGKVTLDEGALDPRRKVVPRA